MGEAGGGMGLPIIRDFLMGRWKKDALRIFLT